MPPKKTILHKTLNRISCPHCSTDESYCLFKVILESSHDDSYARTLMQIKLVEMLKWEASRKMGSDIGWEKAWETWVSEGYAKTFADVYDPAHEPEVLYSMIVRA